MIIVSDEGSGTLTSRLSKYASFKHELRVRLAHKVLEDLLNDLSLMTNYGFVHSDLKPANTVLDKKGRFGLIDFGAMVDSSELGRFAPVGYASPQSTMENHEANSLNNFYSVGSMLLKILSPKTDMTQENMTTPKNVRKRLNEIEGELNLQKSKNLQLTWKTIREFIEASITVNPVLRSERILNSKFGKLFEEGFAKQGIDFRDPSQRSRGRIRCEGLF